MNRDFFSLFWCGAVLGAILICFGEERYARCQVSTKNSLPSLVLLKNTNVITGVARANFEKTIVEQPNGSRIVLMTDQVALICDTYDEVFEFLRSQLDPEDYDGHEQLFRWCIRYQQFDAAQRLIDTLQFTRMSPQVLDALNTQLVVSRSALKQLQVPKNSSREQSTASAMTSGSGPNALRIGQTAAVSVPVADSMVQLAAFSHSHKSSVNDVASPQTVTARELETALRNMPEFGVSSFKRVVEPILAKNCSNAGCHHRQAEVFPLMTMGAGVAIPRRMSQQNLYQILRYVGDGTPDASPLLDRALTAHGPLDSPAIKFHSREHAILLEWVQLMAEPASLARIPQTTPRTATPLPDQIEAPMARNATISQASSIPIVTETNPLAPGGQMTGPAQQQPTISEIASEIQQVSHIQKTPPPSIPDLRTKRGSPLTTDPFDPEIFNRNFFPRQPMPQTPISEAPAQQQSPKQNEH